MTYRSHRPGRRNWVIIATSYETTQQVLMLSQEDEHSRRTALTGYTGRGRAVQHGLTTLCEVAMEVHMWRPRAPPEVAVAASKPTGVIVVQLRHAEVKFR